ncbi:MAG TPA: hypothetical protein VG013_07915 [Gemmataceae bacterium]|jgi:WD40 repeat protein|nr:hypothetical protein [Gemmataceae bacterium]
MEKRKARTDLHGDLLPPRALARLGTTRLREGGDVREIAFCPDGKTLASRTDVGVVRLWDAATGKERRTLHEAEEHRVNCIAFSPDGKTLAGGGFWEGRLWEVATGREVKIPVRGCEAITFCPDGKLLAIGDDHRAVVLWDLAKAAVRHKLQGNDGTHAIAFSPDGQTLAVAGSTPSGAGYIRLWHVATAKAIRRLRGHQGGIASVAFAPDGKTLASGSYDHTIRLWDVAAGKEIRRLEKWALAVAFSPDGKTLASGGPGGLHLWDPQTGKELLRLRGFGSSVMSVAFSPDGKMVATACRDNAVGLWKVPTGEEVFPMPGPKYPVMSVAFSPDGRTLAARSADLAVRLWQVRTGKEFRRLAMMESPDPAYNHEGPFTRVRCVDFSPEGQSVGAAGDFDKGTHVWDAATGKKLVMLRGAASFVTSVAFAPDGKTIATGDRQGIARMWDRRTGRLLQALDFQGKGDANLVEVLSVALSPDGQPLAAGSSDGLVRFWDWSTGRQLRAIRAQRWQVACLAYSPDGKLLVSCGGNCWNQLDATIHVWEVASGTVVRELQGHNGSVASVAFSPDGLTVASAGEGDKTVRLWNAYTGQELAKLEGHIGAVYGIAFSPDGNTLASGSADTSVLLWDVGRLKAQLPRTNRGRGELTQLWKDLGGEAGSAYKAAWMLCRARNAAIRFLREHFKPRSAPDPELLERLIGDLDAKQFATRESAVEQLAKLDRAAEPAIRQALARRPSPEVRRRLESLLTNLRASLVTNAEGLRGTRAVAVLERIGSAEARKVLESLARGTPAANLTQDAKAALERLKRRAAVP